MRCSTILAILCLLQTVISPAQSTSPNQENRTVYESSTVLKAVTRLVVVDVIATNHKGQPLGSLTAKDFTLLEDGKPQQLRFFSLQSGAAAPAAATAPQSQSAAINIVTNVPQRTSGSALNIVLLDALNSSLVNQLDVQQQISKTLASLSGDRPMAVYVLGSKLALLQDFTNDPALLRQAICPSGRINTAPSSSIPKVRVQARSGSTKSPVGLTVQARSGTFIEAATASASSPPSWPNALSTRSSTYSSTIAARAVARVGQGPEA